MESPPSNAGIVTDGSSGERHIPESTRADGTTRKAIKIRPGYRPPEDVEVYKNQTAEALNERRKKMGIPGSEPIDGAAAGVDKPSAAASHKNAKRREAKKKAKAAAVLEDTPSKADGSTSSSREERGKGGGEVVDSQAERERKARALKKKLRQARELKDKSDGGETLLADQVAKISKIEELIHELDALGFDANGEPKPSSDPQ